MSERSAPEPAAVAETHSAVVLFMGERAYKIKKPVRLDVLDFSTPELREAVLRRELELNRRLAPDVYEDVAAVVDSAGRVLDHVLIMKRMPAHRRLSTLVAEGAGVSDCLRDVARRIASFHAGARSGPEIDAVATPEATAARWSENLDVIERDGTGVVDAETVDLVRLHAHRYLDGRGPLLEARIADGRIRDGHGDLLATDIFCLDDGPRILDCIEFDDRLRWGDVLADAAFLAMHLEELGRADLAATFMADYADFGAETHPASLADHYVAYRASVRAKVACIRYRQGDATAAPEARRFLDLCARKLRTARVRVVLVGGPPGTGKTTLATALSDTLGWTLLRSDEIRKDLAGLGHTYRPTAPETAELYGPEATSRTYATMLERARRLLGLGESVVLDAQWTDPKWRSEAEKVAAATASDLVQLRCHTPLPAVLARVAARSAAGTDASDADVEVTRAATEAFTPWPEAVTVDTATTVQAALDAAVTAAEACP